MPLREFIEKQAAMGRERLAPFLERFERMRAGNTVEPPRYALPGAEKTQRAYEADIVATVFVDGLEIPVAEETDDISLAQYHNGNTYRYSGKGTRIEGYSALLPSLVWPYYDEGKDVLLVRYGDSFVIFTT
jgi:hypothetical protein